MIIRFDKDLKKQHIFANGKELATIMGFDKDAQGKRVYSWPDTQEKYVTTIENPVLVTDNYKISKLDSTLRDTVFALYSSPVKLIEYDNTHLRFDTRKYNGVWGPSIDTILFCMALSDKRYSGAAIEVGSGSGFISKYVLENNCDIEKMTMIDLNPYAKSCAFDNIFDSRAEMVSGDAVGFLNHKKYDLMICNPPYIPRPQSIDDNPYEGLGLIKYLISNAKKNLEEDGSIITNISSLCKEEIQDYVLKSDLDMVSLAAMKVPLKVYNVLNNKNWIEYLKKNPGLYIKHAEGYDYWQEIEIVELSIKK